jgi:hypothetical protein
MGNPKQVGGARGPKRWPGNDQDARSGRRQAEVGREVCGFVGHRRDPTWLRCNARFKSPDKTQTSGDAWVGCDGEDRQQRPLARYSPGRGTGRGVGHQAGRRARFRRA